MDSQYNMRQARGRRAPCYKKVDRTHRPASAAVTKSPPATPTPTQVGRRRDASPPLSARARTFATKITKHANAVRDGSAVLRQSDAAYLLGVIDADIGILRSKRILTTDREAQQVRSCVLREVLRNPGAVTEGPQRVHLEAHTKRAYRDF